MPFSKLPMEKAFMLIEPGPVLLISTRDGGRDNIMTLSWHMVMDFTPRIAIATGPWNHSFRALVNTRECVLAVPAVDLAETAVRIGDCSGADVDKFETFALTPLPAAEVKAPLIAECLACLECRVAEYLEPQGIFILEGLRAWIDAERKERRTFHAVGDGTFVADGETFSLRGLMEDKLPPGV
ncbi:flavin reductase family protein [Papillibacter cinnamivorans]|uniref:NADH-FMN oxidoreductase RutF, flavin reductase (DIM6/NTAB) family n=1 Tax=Papillibacter cinnamivorans DSM 12816 TaxID=1122930 RepID=A0A1W1ZH37_9FIRM|nr:flavin reductase family protein [Papillibacter cinnamivorans]SMC47381.1 NADH-FMN oxidoreductase RutF, flavin reductase (DIM6/NTAB) family [Papillibacter cinnamivorans DSM 12816]